ncbi:uncharacterized protein [Malus domestica]|uniref:uncharacterized protein isoform X2 n=1 Tax=Malus domestica TaxID=3750 RepID=UPI003976579E
MIHIAEHAYKIIALTDHSSLISLPPSHYCSNSRCIPFAFFAAGLQTVYFFQNKRKKCVIVCKTLTKDRNIISAEYGTPKNPLNQLHININSINGVLPIQFARKLLKMLRENKRFAWKMRRRSLYPSKHVFRKA